MKLINLRKWGGAGGGLLALIMAFFLIGVVHAEDTPTPTSTATPAPVFGGTGTPSALGDCPVGTPYPTPLSIDYYTYCSVCIPSTSTPAVDITPIYITPIPYGTLPPDGFTPSPQVSITPSPTVQNVTPSITPTSELVPIVRFQRLTDSEINIPEDTLFTWSTNRINYSPLEELKTKIYDQGSSGVYVTYGFAYSLDFTLRYQTGGWYNRYFLRVENKNQTNMTMSFTIDSDIFAGQTISIPSGTTYFIPLTDVSSTTHFHYDIYFDLTYLKVNNQNEDFIFNLGVQSAYNSPYGTLSMQILWQFGGLIPLTTPTPTPSPTPTLIPGYCNEYDYDEGDNPLVDLPPIYIVPGDCFKMIPDFVINLPAIGEAIPAINWGINGMSFCPMWVQMGDFQIAGFVIPSELLLVPALMFLLGLIFLL